MLCAFTTVLLCCAGQGRSQVHEAADLTIRLFSTAPVWTLVLSPGPAEVRLCASCAPQPLSDPVMLSEDAEGRHLHVSGREIQNLFASGDLTMTAASGRVAHVAGRWKVYPARDGLHVTVDVPSERYVMAVLQAEAGPDEPAESLKALAVVVRSFALQNPDRHGVEGLCDSTHCQALRFAAVPARVREAVEATAGETLWFGNGSGARQRSGYFTENCGGTSEDAAVLWGGEKKPWLAVQSDPFCVRRPALWHADISLEQVRAALFAEGVRVPSRVTGLRAAKTDRSGRVALLQLTGETGLSGYGASGGHTQGSFAPQPTLFKAEVSAATFRFALDRAYGWNQLRSDAYRIHVAGDRVLFEGKGFGHGVGLCQAGARAAAEQGRRYRDILRFYFPGTSVRVLADDAGWAMRQGHGWTLRAVSDGNEWIEAGNAAWDRARSLFAADATVAPVLTVYPTTELFRQQTGEPGWDLAATTGEQVGVQPRTVVLRAVCRNTLGDSPCLQALLLHEFLHVLVERQASSSTPLWFREGLVEVLAGESCTAARQPLSQTTAQLDAARSMDESRRGHAEACAQIQRLVRQYGMPSVRTWLREGVPAFVRAGE